MPRHRSPFTGRPRSRRVTRAKYPEEWAWWAASGWKMMLQEGDAGALHLHSYFDYRGRTFWGASATPEEVSTKQEVRRFLATTLYFHLHPTKARRALGATGAVCSEAELAAFIRRQRRALKS